MSAATAPVEVVCLGILVADVLARPVDALPTRGSLAFVDEIALRGGGCALNTSSALVKLGVPAAAVGKVGADAFGDFLLGLLDERGVERSGVRRDPTAPTSASVALVSGEGERTFLHLPGANGRLAREELDPELLYRGRLLHVAGALVLEALDGEPLAAVLAEARRRGLRTSVDTVFDASGRWARLVPSLPHLDIAVPSLDEARAISGEQEPERVAEWFRGRGVGVVALTTGPRGCYVSGDGFEGIVAAPEVSTLDGTGAGDAFAAGLISGLLAGWELERAARFACAAGALATTAVGAYEGVGDVDATLALTEAVRVHPPANRKHPTERKAMKTSLGIWAMGPMITRFVPGGYQPQHASEPTAEKVRRAVDGLGDLIDDYEFHYPQELSADNLDEVRAALDGHGIYCMATGLHLDPMFGRGGLSSPDDAVRGEALARTLDAVDFAGELGAHFIIWPGIEGYNYPFQTAYADSWARFVDGIGQAAQRCRERGIKLFLEHKNSEPAMKIFMRNIGMTLHVIHKLRAQGLDNVQVNMDWQHLIMNGESLAEYAALLAAEGLLGHQHGNSGWGTFDDDNMVGATAFMETLELALELHRAGYGENGERLGFDLYPYTEDAVGAVRRSVLAWRFFEAVARKLDGDELRSAQQAKDAVRAHELVFAALGA